MSDMKYRSEDTLSKLREFSLPLRVIVAAKGFEKNEELRSCQFRHVSKIVKIDFSRVPLSLDSACLPSSIGR